MMKLKVVAIGNSRGVRIPRPLLEQAGIEDEVEAEIAPDGLVLRPVRVVREGWAAAFRAMAERGDDGPLDLEQAPTAWEATDWEW